MRLFEGLGVSSGDVVAFVGAGGKSTAIRKVAEELVAQDMKVLVIPTTKMTRRQADSIGPLVLSEDIRELASAVRGGFASSDVVVAGSAEISRDRIGGIEPDDVGFLAEVADVVLIEADGARGKPIKGTAEHEPVIPPPTTLAVAIAGISAFGKPATEEFVHRPELFSVQTGVGPGQSITARAFARALSDGSLADTPPNTRTAVLITGVEPGPSMSDASVIARELWRNGIKHVAITSLTKEDPPQVWMP